MERSGVTETRLAEPDNGFELSSHKKGPGKARLAIGFTIVLFSAIAAIPFFFMGRSTPGVRAELRMPVTHDMHLHYEQMKSFYHGLVSGAVYPRWEEDTNRHFGAPTMNYYPPAIYYITSICYAVLGDWWSTLLASYLILVSASGATLYLYARQSLSRFASLIAATAYILFPYHILDQYQRGAMAEMLGFVWMPLMLFFAHRLFSKRDADVGLVMNGNQGIRSHWVVYVAGLALCYGAFLWSHPPTAYQFTLAFGIYVVAFAIWRRNLRGLFHVAGAMVLAIGLSAGYLISAALEQELIQHEYVSENWPYHATYVFLHALPYRDPHMGFFNLIDAVWTFYAVGIGIAALFLILVKRTRLPSGMFEHAASWVFIGIFAAFMMTKPSYFAGGKFIPKIDIGVFAWRMLGISTLVVSLLTGVFADGAFGRRGFSRRTRVLFGLAAAFLLGIGISISALLVVRPMYLAPMMVPSLEHINLAMIPRTAPEDPATLPHLNEARLEKGQGEIYVRRWDPERRELDVFLTESDRLLIRTFNFPGWIATINGEMAPIITGSQFGEVTLDLVPGFHEIELKFRDTAARRTGEAVTLSSLLVIAFMIVIPLARRSRRSSKRETAEA
jgi:hypothetical protein